MVSSFSKVPGVQMNKIRIKKKKTIHLTDKTKTKTILVCVHAQMDIQTTLY